MRNILVNYQLSGNFRSRVNGNVACILIHAINLFLIRHRTDRQTNQWVTLLASVVIVHVDQISLLLQPYIYTTLRLSKLVADLLARASSLLASWMIGLLCTAPSSSSLL